MLPAPLISSHADIDGDVVADEDADVDGGVINGFFVDGNGDGSTAEKRGWERFRLRVAILFWFFLVCDEVSIESGIVEGLNDGWLFGGWVDVT